MLVSISYRIAMVCPECSQQVPVNHLRTSMVCCNCLATVDLLQHDLAWWNEPIVGQVALRGALIEPDGKVGEVKCSTVTVESFRGTTDCPTCRRPMTREALVAGASTGTYRCECGFACSCRDAEPSLVQSFRYARWLLGEAPPAAAAPDAAHPIVMPCMECGAGLKIDGSSRVVECSFCDAANYLPDGLWLRLHPAPRKAWVRLVLEIDEASLLELQRHPFDML